MHCYYTFLSPLQAYHKYVEFWNKRIEMYDELTIVMGKDMVIGNFVKSYIDVEIMGDNGEKGVVDKGEREKMW